MNTDLHTFFRHSLYIERTVYNESLTWDDWLTVSATSKRIREAVLSLRPFRVFVLGRSLIKKCSEDIVYKDYRGYLLEQGYLHVLRAFVGDFYGLSNFPICFDFHYGDLAQAIARSSLDRKIEKIKELLDNPYCRNQISWTVVKHIADNGDESSLDLALELAELKPFEHIEYHRAICYIGRKYLEIPTRECRLKAENLVKGRVFFDIFPLKCQLVVTNGQDLKAFINNYMNQEPIDPRTRRFTFLDRLITWRLSQKDAEAVDHSLEISCYASDSQELLLLVDSIYRSVVDRTSNYEEIERLQKAINELAIRKNVFFNWNIFGYKQFKIDLCRMQDRSEQSIQQMIDRLPEEKKHGILASMICESFKDQIKIEHLAFIMRLEPSKRCSCLSFVIKQLSTPVFLKIESPKTFISDVHKIVNPDERVEPPSFGGMIARLITK